ncbi:hypothetical protein TRVL_04937 [Trypanosoma vivax]|nr:hypothetical protein TRVL_04937 [Trypanosoma vivax]
MREKTQLKGAAVTHRGYKKASATSLGKRKEEPNTYCRALPLQFPHETSHSIFHTSFNTPVGSTITRDIARPTKALLRAFWHPIPSQTPRKKRKWGGGERKKKRPHQPWTASQMPTGGCLLRGRPSPLEPCMAGEPNPRNSVGQLPFGCSTLLPLPTHKLQKLCKSRKGLQTTRAARYAQRCLLDVVRVQTLLHPPFLGNTPVHMRDPSRHLGADAAQQAGSPQYLL